MQQKKNKARSPIQKRGIETREKIVKAGMTLFAKKGFHRTNALEIAARAGLATGTFYSYFNNKKEVLVEVIRMFYRNASQEVLNVYDPVAGDDPAGNYAEGRKLVHSMIRTLDSAHRLDPHVHREILAMTLIDPDIARINAEEEKKVVAYMTALLGRFREFIRVEDLEAAAVLLYRTGEEIVHRIRVVGSEIDGQRLLAELEEMMCRYLLKDETRAGEGS